MNEIDWWGKTRLKNISDIFNHDDETRATGDGIDISADLIAKMIDRYIFVKVSCELIKAPLVY